MEKNKLRKTFESFLEGLEELGKLKRLFDCCSNSSAEYLSKKNLKEPLEELFVLAKKRMSLSERDRHLPELVLKSKLLPKKAEVWLRDTDEKHTVSAFGYLTEICHRKNYLSNKTKKALSAITFHDAATKKDFKSREARIRHMQDAAEAFRNASLWLNEKFLNFYLPIEIKDIASIIEKHDNPNIGIPFEYNDPQIEILLDHRAADLLWRTDFRGFALDLARIILEKDGEYDPESFFISVLKKHKKEAELYQKDLGFKDLLGIKVPYTDNISFEIFRNSADRIMKDYNILEGRVKRELKN